LAKKARKRVNPLDTVLNAKEKLAADRKADDHALWSVWKDNPSQENTHNLLRRFEPVFRNKVQQYKAPNVNTSAFRADLKLHALNAFETYDPSKAGLRTHVENHLRKSMRYNAQQQNMAYLPEGQSERIGSLDRAKEDFMEEQGRDPSHAELATFINERPDLLRNKSPLTATQVARIQTGRRKDIVGSTFESDPAPVALSRNEQVLGLLRPSLGEQEQRVFDHIYGTNGTPVVSSTSALAKKLNMSPSQVSRLKTNIATTYKRYL
jgi:DNA-directed RNA polymerase specialized sigma subunit